MFTVHGIGDYDCAVDAGGPGTGARHMDAVAADLVDDDDGLARRAPRLESVRSQALLPKRQQRWYLGGNSSS